MHRKPLLIAPRPLALSIIKTIVTVQYNIKTSNYGGAWLDVIENQEI